jgi:hypothetical protein
MLLVHACATLVISISTTAEISPTLVDHVVDETNAIWRPAGVTLVAERTPAPSSGRLGVVIGSRRGAALANEAPMGWIEFSDGQPQPQLYLSFTNAVVLLEAARGPMESSLHMPVLERETYLGRALGRALAHELGHYLLASKAHTAHGLMKANFTAAEFFATNTRQFLIDASERAIVEARLDAMALVASATSGASSPTSPRPASRPRGAARWQGPTSH